MNDVRDHRNSFLTLDTRIMAKELYLQWWWFGLNTDKQISVG